MISSKAVTAYGYITIIILLVMLALVWFGVVDQSFHVPILVVAALLIVSRIVMRALARRSNGILRRNDERDGSDTDATGVG